MEAGVCDGLWCCEWLGDSSGWELGWLGGSGDRQGDPPTMDPPWRGGLCSPIQCEVGEVGEEGVPIQCKE